MVQKNNRFFYSPKKYENSIKKQKKLSTFLNKEKILTVHHRRPIPLDGSRQSWNLSYIPEDIHKAWTIIMGNMNAEQICNHINIYFKPKKVTVICHFINGIPCKKTGICGTKNIDKIYYAWNILFKKYPHFIDKINIINNRLLDPSYHLYIKE